MMHSRLFKSPNTKPLRAEFCNVPINCPEDFRDGLDALKQDGESRNALIQRAIVAGIASLFGAAKSIHLQSILDAHKLAAQIAAAFALGCFICLQFGAVKRDTARPRVARTRTVRRKLDEMSFYFHEGELA